MSTFGDIKPLKAYLGDREKMVEQVFSCVSENQVKKMLPDILKDLPFSELKAECLIQLLGMNEKRILSALEGRELESSSSSESEYSKRRLEIVRGPKRREESGPSQSSAVRADSSSSDADVLEIKVAKAEMDEMTGVENRPSKKTEECRPPKRKKAAEEEGGEESKRRKSRKQKRKKGRKKRRGSSSSSSCEGGGKNLLELLELEMRARAIRALLKKETAAQDDEGKGEEEGKEEEDKAEKGKRREKEEEGEDKRSWAERWLESEEVQRVVVTSKMMRQVRSNVLSARLPSALPPH